MIYKKRILFSVTTALILCLQQAALPAAAADSDDSTDPPEMIYYEDGRVVPYDSDVQPPDSDYEFGPDGKPIPDEDGLYPDWYYYDLYSQDDDVTYPSSNPDLEWKYKRGVLTISGTGPMDEYSYETAPWYEFNNAIEEIDVLDGITTISYNAFNGLPRLEEVHIADSVTKIDDYAFCGSMTLEEIELPPNLTEIGEYAFSGCGLKEIEIPESVRSLGASAFSSCDQLEKVILHEGLEEIQDECFLYCFQLADIEIPMSVQTIGRSIMRNCSTYFAKYPNSCIVVGDGFMIGCTDDSEEITVPDGVKHICTGAFNLTNLSDDIYYTGWIDQHPTLRIVTMPDSLIDIGREALADLPNLETVILPEKMKSIGFRAFGACENLQHVQMPVELETIEDGAFIDCTSLSDLKVPPTVTKIGANAFFRTPFYASFDDFAILGDGILYAYRGRAKRVEIPDGVKTINTNAFERTKVVTIKCPDSLRCIKERAFPYSDLMEIELNDGLVTLEPYAFDASLEIKSLNIPESLVDFKVTSVTSELDYIVGNGPVSEKFAYIYHCAHYSEPPEDGTYFKTDPLDPEKECWSFGNFSEIFGNDYYFTDHDAKVVKEVSSRDSLLNKEEWTGACFGMTDTILLVKAGLIKPEQIQKGAKSLSDIKPTKEVQSFINYYHNVQYVRAFTAVSSVVSDSKRFYQMIKTAEQTEKGGLPFMISFQTPDFGHAVIGYGLEEGKWIYYDRPFDRRIKVWDPNYPTEDHVTSYLYYNDVTFDYCIPHYDLRWIDGNSAKSNGRILYYCNDLERLNPYPYEFVEDAETVYQNGDCNLDGQVDVSDAVLLARFCAEDTEAVITKEGRDLADVDDDGKITPDDTIRLLRIIAKFDIPKITA